MSEKGYLKTPHPICMRILYFSYSSFFSLINNLIINSQKRKREKDIGTSVLEDWYISFSLNFSVGVSGGGI